MDALVYLPSAVVKPAELPNWLETGRTPMTPLDAVMFHPAEEITAALAAAGTADLEALLTYLAAPVAAEAGGA